MCLLMGQSYAVCDTAICAKNIYQFYEVMKKKILHLQSASFVLRSFIYQC